MKHHSLRVLALCALFLTSCAKTTPGLNQFKVQPLPTSSSSERAWEVTLSVHDLRFEVTAEGNRVSGPELYPISQPGEPELVGASTLFSVPEDWKYEVDLIDSQSANRENIDIAPYALCYRCADAPKEVTRDETIYNSAADFPRGPFQVQLVGTQEGEKVIRLTLHPLIYSPRQHRLTTLHELKLRFTARGQSSPRSTKTWLSSLTPSVEDFGVRSQKAATPRRFVIIAADTFLNDPVLAEFVQWKRDVGFDVELTPASMAGNSTSSVLAYLNVHAGHTGDFVLIVGDQLAVPTFFETVGWQIAATDWPYARVSATTPFPLRFVGRVTASNATQLHTQLKRFIDSDKSGNTTGWYRRGTTLASAEGFSPSDVQYARSIENLWTEQGFDLVDRFYEGLHNSYPAAIRTALTEGRAWVSYFGHGSGTGWSSTNVDFGIEDVYQLDNRGHLPMIVDVACDNGAWTKLNPSFSEAWMNHEIQGEPAGSVGYYGGSVKVSWHEPAVMSVGVADYRFRRKAALMGPAVFAGQMYMLEKLGVNKLTLNNLSSYNLFGDPTLVVRTSTENEFVLSATAQTIGANRVIVVDVKTLSGGATTGLYLGFSSNGVGLDRVEISNETTLTRTLPANATKAKITAYGNGWITKQIEVTL